jgi:hypothetical protein
MNKLKNLEKEVKHKSLFFAKKTSLNYFLDCLPLRIYCTYKVLASKITMKSNVDSNVLLLSVSQHNSVNVQKKL